MNARKSYVLLFIFIAGLAVLYFYNKYRVAPGLDLKTLNLSNESGQRFPADSLRGRKTIVSFYASWCGDCLKELKNLDAVKSTELADVRVLAITDEPVEKLVSFKNKKQYPFTFLKLDKRFDEIGIHSIPVVYLLNAKGEITYQHVGYVDWQDPSTLAHLKKLLE